MKALLMGFTITFFVPFLTTAQTKKPIVEQTDSKPTMVIAEGIIVIGYVDQGAYINFVGPSLRLVKKPTWTLSVGMLPTLRIKADNAISPAKKNSIIWPTTGAGITFTAKHLAIQVPFYYNNKTTSTDGQWAVGFGLGYKF